MKTGVSVMLGALLLSYLGTARAADEADRTLSPYFVVEGGDPKVDKLPLDGTKVDVAVSGVIAEVNVTQSYRNEGTRPIHAHYVFPASTRAAVHGMKMTIGNRTVTAKIKEKEKARAEYDASKKAGKTASLLEEQRPNVFTMDVANVLPGDHIDVTLTYSELLVPTAGTYEFVYPTVVGPRYGNVPAATASKESKFVATPYLHEGVGPTSTFALAGTLSSPIPIRDVESPTHKLTASNDNATLTRFAIAPDSSPASNRDFILHYGLSGAAIQSGLSLYDSGGEKFFLLVVQPPKRVMPEQIPPREYVFVLDVSGSMEGFPLDTAKTLLRKLSLGLRTVDTFNVILFSGASHLYAPRSLPATKENIEQALAVIGQERGGGGTELLPALEQALSLPQDKPMSRSFVVMTDGYIEADREAIHLVREHLGSANVFSFGIGSSVNRFLVEGIAKAGQGEPFVATDPKDAVEKAARFNEYVSAPVLSKVRVGYDGFDAYDVEPAQAPDVFADRPVIVHGKWRGPLHGAVTVSGLSGTGAYSQRFDVSQTAPRIENKALVPLWARARVASLSDFGFGEPTDATRREVTDLGLKYGLLTQYTSFIAVSEVVRNPGGKGENVEQALPLPAGVSESAVAEMQGAPEPELLVLAGVLAFVLAALSLKNRLEVA